MKRRLAPDRGNKKMEEVAQVPLFDHVPRSAPRTIASNIDEVRVGAGETLVREGHHNDAFRIVIEGQAEMTIGGRKRRMVGRGQFVGATSVLDRNPAVGSSISSMTGRRLSVWASLKAVVGRIRFPRNAACRVGREIPTERRSSSRLKASRRAGDQQLLAVHDHDQASAPDHRAIRWITHGQPPAVWIGDAPPGPDATQRACDRRALSVRCG